MEKALGEVSWGSAGSLGDRSDARVVGVGVVPGVQEFDECGDVSWVVLW